MSVLSRRHKHRPSGDASLATPSYRSLTSNRRAGPRPVFEVLLRAPLYHFVNQYTRERSHDRLERDSLDGEHDVLVPTSQAVPRRSTARWSTPPYPSRGRCGIREIRVSKVPWIVCRILRQCASGRPAPARADSLDSSSSPRIHRRNVARRLARDHRSGMLARPIGAAVGRRALQEPLLGVGERPPDVNAIR